MPAAMSTNDPKQLHKQLHQQRIENDRRRMECEILKKQRIFRLTAAFTERSFRA